VVASEVRTLAQRSASAAKEIKALIGASVGRAQLGSDLAVKAGLTMQEVVDSVKQVSDIIVEISAASAEQEVDIIKIDGAIGEMDSVTQQNAALVEEAAAASRSLQDQADDLRRIAATFVLDEDTGIAAHAGRPVARLPA
jgi:methyl-accepting chemotaxis protein